MIGRSSRRLAALAGAVAVIAGVAAPTAHAAGNGLRRGYTAQRVDSPQPEVSGLFSLALNVAGDLNGDGKQDVIAPQVAGLNTQGACTCSAAPQAP